MVFHEKKDTEETMDEIGEEEDKKEEDKIDEKSKKDEKDYT